VGSVLSTGLAGASPPARQNVNPFTWFAWRQQAKRATGYCTGASKAELSTPKPGRRRPNPLGEGSSP